MKFATHTLLIPMVILPFTVAVSGSSLFTTFTVPNSQVLTTIPSGINDQGQIVGSFQDLNGIFEGFVLSSDGQSYSTFKVPGSIYTTALGINNNGYVIGLYSYFAGGGTEVYIRALDGSIVPLPNLLGRPVNIDSLGLNNSGKVVGSYRQNNEFQSFLCDLVATSCAQLAIPGADATVAKSINDDGQVVGYVQVGTQIRAFLLNVDATYMIFDDPDATLSTIATSISTDGKIVGYFSGPTGVHNFLRAGTDSFVSFDDSNVAPGNSYAAGINANGEVVGYSAPSFDHYQGFLALSPVGDVISDEFNGATLNPLLWTLINPAGGSYSLTGTNLLLSVPGGAGHDPGDGGMDNAVRIVQSIGNVNFDVVAKFDSIPTAQYTNEGILVEQDGSDYLRFEMYFARGQSYLYAGTIIGGVETPQLNTPVAAGASSFWLRVTRAGNNWMESWSTDGTNYTAVVTFWQALTTARIGPYGANFADPPSSAPAFTASIDYFRNLNTPVPNLTVSENKTNASPSMGSLRFFTKTGSEARRSEW